jgi:DHA1 family multidrug resistance protein-like MFS transporter
MKVNLAETDQALPGFSWKRNLYIVWTAQLIAMIGMSACIPFLPLYIRELGIRDLAEAQRWCGLVYAAPFFLAILVTPFWGNLSDGKYGKKLMVVRAIFGLAFAMFLMGFAQNVWQLFLLRLLQGGISGFIAANLVLVSSSSPQEHVGYAIGFLQTSLSCGTMLGPLVGGIFADVFGVRQVFFLVACMCCTSGIIVVCFVQEKKIVDTSVTRHSIWHNILFVCHRQQLRNILFFITLCQAGIVMTTPILAYYLELLHTPPSYLGTVTGIMVGTVGLLSTIFAPIWGVKNDRQQYRKTLQIALPFIGLATIAHSFVTYYVWLFPLRVIIGIFTAAVIPTLYTVLSKSSPNEMRGGLMGLASSATLFGNLCGPLLCSWVSVHFGMQATFGLAGGLVLLVYLLVSWPKTIKLLPLVQYPGRWRG